MVAITATNSATPSLQASLSKTRLQQARRDADQAESVAQNLRAQVTSAETEVQRTQSRVRSLAASDSNTEPTYRAQREIAPSGLRPESQSLLVDLYQRANAARGPVTNPLLAANASAPVQNTQGQLTGRIINVQA